MRRPLTYVVPVLLLGGLGYALCTLPTRDELRQQFGDERWTCAPLVPNKPSMKRVGWVSTRTGLRIVVGSRSSVSYLKLTCRHVDEHGRCDAAEGGWQRVETETSPGAGPTTGAPAAISVAPATAITVDHTTPGVDGSYFLDAPMSGPLAERLVATFTANRAVKVVARDRTGAEIFAQSVDLAGFDAAMTACGF